MRLPPRPGLAARALALTVALCAASPALADDQLWVESAPLDSRETAERLVTDAGLDLDGGTVRVLRRFVKGDGWRFVVRVDGSADQDDARQVAASLAAAGARASVLLRDEDGVQILHEVGVTGGGTGPAAPVEPVVDAAGNRLPDARAVLRGAVRAHGGAKGGLELVEQAVSLTLAFERTVAVDGGQLVAANRYFRQGEALRLEVEIVDGVGTDSVTVVTPGNRAWVVVDGEAVPRDVARTREVIARFAPEAVLAVPLGLARDVAEAADWQDLRVVGLEVLDDSSLLRLEPAEGAPSTEGLAAAWFDAGAGTLSRVDWRSPSGLLTFGYADYRELADGLVVPFRAWIERDQRPVEQVRVLELALDEPLAETLFAEP